MLKDTRLIVDKLDNFACCGECSRLFTFFGFTQWFAIIQQEHKETTGKNWYS